MHRAIWSLALVVGGLGACTSEPADTDGDDDPNTPFVHEVMKDCAPAEGRICPFAGTGDSGFNGEGQALLDAWMSLPMSITFSPYGKPIIADWNNHKLRMIEDDGTLTTIMGTNFLGDGDFGGLDMAEGVPGTEVNLNHPTQQRYFPDGRLLSASWHTHKLRVWDPFLGGMVRVVIGGPYGFKPLESDPPGEWQPAVGSELNQPRWVEIDSNGDVWILDMRNQRIRKLDMLGYRIQTVAGTGTYGAGGPGGDAECESTAALETCFAFPDNWNPEPGGAMQFSEDEQTLYILDSESHQVRALDIPTGIVRLIAGAPGEPGDVDGEGVDARFYFPTGLVIDHETNELFVADTNNHKVKSIDLATGRVTTIVGTGEMSCPHDGAITEVKACAEQSKAGDGGPAIDATLFRPFGVDLDLDGNLVIADTFNQRFRIVYR